MCGSFSETLGQQGTKEFSYKARPTEHPPNVEQPQTHIWNSYCTCIYTIYDLNVGSYSIHGWSGIVEQHTFPAQETARKRREEELGAQLAQATSSAARSVAWAVRRAGCGLESILKGVR